MSSKYKQRWSREDEGRCCELLKHGWPYARIAEELQRSEAAIAERADRLGHGPKKPQHYWSEDQDQHLERLWRQGLADVEIARLLGRTVSGVERRRQKLGYIKADPGTPSAAELAERARPLLTLFKTDLFALWDARNTALRRELQTQGLLPDAEA